MNGKTASCVAASGAIAGFRRFIQAIAATSSTTTTPAAMRALTGPRARVGAPSLAATRAIESMVLVTKWCGADIPVSALLSALSSRGYFFRRLIALRRVLPRDKRVTTLLQILRYVRPELCERLG